jgi:hypothetical protein
VSRTDLRVPGDAYDSRPRNVHRQILFGIKLGRTADLRQESCFLFPNVTEILLFGILRRWNAYRGAPASTAEMVVRKSL